MNNKFKNIALQVGGSHYPEVGGELLQKFGEMVVQECIDIIQKIDYRDSVFTTHDKACKDDFVQVCINNISQSFKE